MTFSVWANDHMPKHVHGFYESTEVVIDLKSNGVALAKRSKSVKGGTVKTSTVKKLLKTAAENLDELNQLWESVHGKG